MPEAAEGRTTEPTVLVIEKDGRRAVTWETVLRFMGYTPRIVGGLNDLAWPEDNQHDWLAVLVSQGRDAELVGALVDRFSSCFRRTPLLLIGGVGPRDNPVSNVLCWRLPEPVRYPALSRLLTKAQRIYDSDWACGQGDGGQFRPTGCSPAVRRLRHLIRQVAAYDTNVLIRGESGTGKEWVARNIHELSTRAHGPFVPVNCGAIPPDLLESELFGHKKGAFTGAISDRCGRFEMANGGTLFLDEIGDMSFSMQVKLLRVLEERKVERVGSDETRPCDVRIIAATHRHLEDAIEAGTFRQDLFFRLNVFPINVPPLRERIEDLPGMITDLAAEVGDPRHDALRFTRHALLNLSRYHWPGNIRELSNLVERLSLMHPGGTVEAGDLPKRYRTVPDEEAVIEKKGATVTRLEVSPRMPADGLNLKEHLSDIEANIIRKALTDADGTVARAARLLGIGRTTLLDKLRKYQL